MTLQKLLLGFGLAFGLGTAASAAPLPVQTGPVAGEAGLVQLAQHHHHYRRRHHHHGYGHHRPRHHHHHRRRHHHH